MCRPVHRMGSQYLLCRTTSFRYYSLHTPLCNGVTKLICYQNFQFSSPHHPPHRLIYRFRHRAFPIALREAQPLRNPKTTIKEQRAPAPFYHHLLLSRRFSRRLLLCRTTFANQHLAYSNCYTPRRTFLRCFPIFLYPQQTTL